MDTTLIHHWIRWIHWRSIVFTKFICAMPNLLQTYIFTTFWSLLVRHFEPTTHCVYFKYVEWLYFSSSLHLRDEYLTFIESCIHTQYACLCTNTDTHLATNEERKKNLYMPDIAQIRHFCESFYAITSTLLTSFTAPSAENRHQCELRSISWTVSSRVEIEFASAILRK